MVILEENLVLEEPVDLKLLPNLVHLVIEPFINLIIYNYFLLKKYLKLITINN